MAAPPRSSTRPVAGPEAPPVDVALLGVALLGVALLAVSASGPLIRYAAAPALAVAMWRNLLALAGYPAGTWLAIVALVVGPQLFGHTLVNRVLRTISATAVSVAILFEVVGASVIAAIAFDETPPLTAAPAGVLILAGIVVVIRSNRRRVPEGAPLG